MALQGARHCVTTGNSLQDTSAGPWVCEMAMRARFHRQLVSNDLLSANDEVPLLCCCKELPYMRVLVDGLGFAAAERSLDNSLQVFAVPLS